MQRTPVWTSMISEETHMITIKNVKKLGRGEKVERMMMMMSLDDEAEDPEETRVERNSKSLLYLIPKLYRKICSGGTGSSIDRFVT